MTLILNLVASLLCDVAFGRKKAGEIRLSLRKTWSISQAHAAKTNALVVYSLLQNLIHTGHPICRVFLLFIRRNKCQWKKWMGRLQTRQEVYPSGFYLSLVCMEARGKKKTWRGLLWSRARGEGTDNRRKCSSVIELHLTRPVRLVFRLCFLPCIKGAFCLHAKRIPLCKCKGIINRWGSFPQSQCDGAHQHCLVLFSHKIVRSGAFESW